ncbi:MAG: mechanosensitive ion channel domain-containing protein, partial [Pseudomonadota bacterium]
MLRVSFAALSLLVLTLGSSLADSSQSASDGFDLREQRWTQTLDSVAQDLARSGLLRSQITPLRNNLIVVQNSVLAARDSAARGADEQKRLLDALGPKPDSDGFTESRGVAEARATISLDFQRFEAWRKRSELTLARIDILFARMADAELRALARILTERTGFPLTSSNLTMGLEHLGKRLTELKTGLQVSWSSISVSHMADRRLLLSLGLFCAVVAIMVALRWRPLIKSDDHAVTEPPTLGRRLLAFVSLFIVNVVLPASAVAAFWGAMRSIQMLPETLYIAADLLLFELLSVVILVGLSTSVLAPGRPNWRISRFRDDAASSLHQAVRLFLILRYAVVAVFVIVNPPQDSTERFFEESISAFFAADPNLHSVLGLLALVIVVVALLNVLRPRNWRFRNHADDQADRDDTPPSHRLRIALFLARSALVLAVLLGVFGYLYAGMYLADRISFTLGLVSLAFLMRALAAEGLRYLSATKRKVGRKLRHHLAFDEGGAARLIFWLLLLLDAALVVALTVFLALRWGVPEAEFWRLAAVLVRGVNIGSYTLSLIDVASAAAVFLVLLALVRLLQGFLTNRVLPQTRLDVGARDALATGFGYAGLVIAALVAFSLLGLDLSQLALILGALSVGIGFGLQHVVSNFIAGLILLIQRPIKSGDWIVVGNGAHQGYVKHVNVTSTEIQTFDNASVLVPNSNLLSNEVQNWTHKNTLGRVILAVGVAYGSDPVQVRQLLLDCAAAHPLVLPRP